MIDLPKTTSRWRQLARERIAAVLAGLPLDATLPAKRAALRAANPWQSGPEHGRKMWRLEVALVLATAGKPAPLPKCYRVHSVEERVFIDAIREAALDRASIYFEATDILVLADWYDERDDRRGAAWRLLGTGKVWPICNTKRTVWQWHQARHTLRANWEIDDTVFGLMSGRHWMGQDDSGRNYEFRNYKSLFTALCAFVVAYAKVVLP